MARSRIVRRFSRICGHFPQAQLAESEGVCRLVEDAGLFGRGIPWVGAHVFTATQRSRMSIWTLDHQLASAAKALRVSAGTTGVMI